jgi:acyl dehydratase
LGRSSSPVDRGSAKKLLKAFAAEFDPQPFRLDEEAAQLSRGWRQGAGGKGLAASGWDTAALTMRLLLESELKPAGGIVGAGLDEFRWPRPVRRGMSCISRANCWLTQFLW